MEALNQSENNSTEDDEVIDPITITVNAGASLSAPKSASIARKRKVSINKGKNKQRQEASKPPMWVHGIVSKSTQTNTLPW